MKNVPETEKASFLAAQGPNTERRPGHSEGAVTGAALCV